MSRSARAGDPAGWYLDTTGHARLRYWDGNRPAPWVSDGTDSRPDPYVVPRRVTAQDAASLRFVREVFLPLARTQQRVPVESLDALSELTWAMTDRLAMATATAAAPAAAAATATASAAAAPAARVATAPVAAGGSDVPLDLSALTADRIPVTTPQVIDRPVVVPTPHEPGPIARWWARTKDEVGSDIATHGLAYLGVLLLFVGVFGLVAFAFGDVAEGTRPIAEIGIATAPFVAAWMLLRRGAVIAGRALELAGGLLLPIMLITSYLDGVGFPPDLLGAGLAIALTATTGIVAAAYAAWSVRHRASALRYLVAPVAWLACAMAVLGVGRDMPSGSGVAVATAAQVSAIAVAMVVSLVLARMRPDALLARPTLVAAVPGAVVVALLAVLTWISGGFPLVPVLVTGLAGVLVLELLDTTLPSRSVRVAQPLWWGLVAIGLVASLDPFAAGVAIAGAAAAIGFLVLLEVDSRATDPWPMALSAAGLVASYALVWTDPWWALGASVALALWAGVRRLRPYPVGLSAPVLDVVAGALPVAAVLALGLATRHAPLAILVGSVLVAAALLPLDVPAIGWRLRRDAADHFWQLWWDAGMVVATVALLVLVTQFWPDVESARWIAVATPLVLAGSAALGPVPRAWRAWPTTGLALLAWVLVGVVLGLPHALVAGAAAEAGLALVAVAHLMPGRVQRWAEPGSLGLAGLALGAVALALGIGSGSAAVAVLVASLTAGCVLTTAYDEVRTSPVASLLVALAGRAARYAMPILTGALVPVSAVLLLDAAGLLATESAWDGLVLSATALVYAGLAHARASDRLRHVLVWGATALVLLALVGTGSESALLAALVVVAALPLVLPTGWRPQAAQWTAWSALAPVVGLVGVLALPAFHDLSVAAQVPFVLVLVGGVLVVASTAYDAARSGWSTRPLPALRWLRPAVWTGAAEVALGALLTVLAPAPWAGAVLAMTVVVVAAAGVLQRVWSWLGLAALLAWATAWELWSAALLDRTWIGLVVAAVLAGAAELAWRLDRHEVGYARAEVPLVAVAHVTAGTALLLASTEVVSALTAVGCAVLAVALALVVILRRRRDAEVAFGESWNAVVGIGYLVLAATLVVWAGAICGSGWLAVALTAVSLACTVVAMRLAAGGRWVLVGIGAGTWLGAWLAFLDWYGAGWVATSDATVLLAAAVVVVCAALLRWTALDRVTLLLRGSVALVTLTLAPLVASGSAGAYPVPDATTWPLVAALALAAAGLGVVAAPLAQHWLRYASVVYAGTAVAAAFVITSPSAPVSVAILSVLALVSAGSVLRAPWRARLDGWAWPVILAGAVAWVAAFAPALSLLPAAAATSVVLLVGAVRTAAVGTAYRLLVPRLASPLLACAAWVVWALEALDGNPQWFTVPIGLALLVVVGGLRSDRRARGLDVGTADVVLLELVGVGVLVGSSFVQAFTDSLAYALLAALLGVGVMAWAVLTRVRRRLVLGGAIVLAALAVLVLVPLAQLLPAWSTAAPWIAIACVGLAAILVATLLEQGRAVVRRGIAELHRVTQGWE